MHRFPALNLARGLRLKASAGAQHNEAHRDDDAGSYRPGLFPFGDAEMAEQVVSDAIVQACVLGCGSPRRGCGIPADDDCLLAMLGTAQSGRAGQPRRAGQKAAGISAEPMSADPWPPGDLLSSSSLPAASTSPVSSR